MVKGKTRTELEKQESRNSSAEEPSEDIGQDVLTPAAEREEIEPAEDIQQIRLELDEYKNLYLRKAAEFENFKKRKQQEFQALIQSAEDALIVDLLPALDDFDRFLASNEADRDSLMQGAQFIRDKLWDALAARGLKPIESVGNPFDPELHEALMQQEEDGVEPGVVLQEHQRGYRLGDRVIRHAKVVVSA